MRFKNDTGISVQEAMRSERAKTAFFDKFLKPQLIIFLEYFFNYIFESPYFAVRSMWRLLRSRCSTHSAPRLSVSFFGKSFATRKKFWHVYFESIFIFLVVSPASSYAKRLEVWEEAKKSQEIFLPIGMIYYP